VVNGNLVIAGLFGRKVNGKCGSPTLQKRAKSCKKEAFIDNATAKVDASIRLTFYI